MIRILFLICVFLGQLIGSNDGLVGLCEKCIVVHCKVLRDLLDQHPFSFVPFIRLTLDFVLHYLFQAENQVLIFDAFVVQCLNLVKGIVLCAEYKPAKVIEGTHENCSGHAVLYSRFRHHYRY